MSIKLGADKIESFTELNNENHSPNIQTEKVSSTVHKPLEKIDMNTSYTTKNSKIASKTNANFKKILLNNLNKMCDLSESQISKTSRCSPPKLINQANREINKGNNVKHTSASINKMQFSLLKDKKSPKFVYILFI